MKFTINRSNRFDYSKWHVWFAWHPVKLNNRYDDILPKQYIWLERICRRKIGGYSYTNFIDRLLCTPEYEYKESILDILKEGHE